MPDTYTLDTLPLEILLLIFDYCHPYDLMRLSYVCKWFNHVLSNQMFWTERCKKQLVTNQLSKRFRARCNPLLSLQLSKWIISYNWKYGNYKKVILDEWTSSRTSLFPSLFPSCVQMNNNILWWSNNNILHSFKRTKHDKTRSNGIDNRMCDKILSTDCASNICKFVLCNNAVISGHSDGNIRIWINKAFQKERMYKSSKICIAKTLSHGLLHYCAVNAIDAISEYIISGSDNGVLQMHANMLAEDDTPSETLIDYRSHRNNKILSVAIDPRGKRFAVSFQNYPYLCIFNADNQRIGGDPTFLLGFTTHGDIIDLLWEGPNTLLTCSDSFIQEWDLRQNRNVHSWHYSSHTGHTELHCISSDNAYTMMTGTGDGKALLWDKRRNTFIQKYSVDKNNAIFSLQFDSSHLYAATNQRLYEYKFAAHSPH